jgi:hypothetical protein
MTRPNFIPGLGGVAFGILFFLAMLVSDAPGGEYSESDVTSYLDDGHQGAVIVSLYLAMVAIAGLVTLLASLRGAITSSHAWAGRLFWGTGVAAAAALAIGWAIVVTPPASLAVGGGEAADPKTTYLVTQAGWVIALGAGGLLLGIALVVLMLDSPGGLPAWVRWVTLIAGLLGLASIAFFPFFALLLWGLVIGVWLLATGWAGQRTAAG